METVSPFSFSPLPAPLLPSVSVSAGLEKQCVTSSLSTPQLCFITSWRTAVGTFNQAAWMFFMENYI